jgi:hypothetical protein
MQLNPYDICMVAVGTDLTWVAGSRPNGAGAVVTMVAEQRGIEFESIVCEGGRVAGKGGSRSIGLSGLG